MGSLIQPSIGIALSKCRKQSITTRSFFITFLGFVHAGMEGFERLTFVKNVAQWAIVQYHHLAQIRFHRAQILDVCPVAERAMLPVVPPREILPFLLQPVDDRVGVFLYRGREDNQVVPFADFAQEVVAVGAFVHVVKDGVLRPERGAAEADGARELDFHHMAAGHAAAFCEGMDEGFVKVNDKGFLGEGGGCLVGEEGVGGLASRDERPGRSGRPRVFGNS